MPSRDELPPTWTSLLAHFTGLAQRALALPDTPEGRRLRDAVPHLIALQGVAHALDHVERLGHEERAVGLDRGTLIIAEHTGALHALYRAQPMPDALAGCVEDARRALAGAASIGQAWVVTAEALIVEHPAQLVAEVLAAGFAGELMLPMPGVPLFRTCPCAFVREADARACEDQVLALIGLFLGQRERLARGPLTARPAQVYRQFDFGRGGPVRDLVRPLAADPVAGQPLLLVAIAQGQAQPVPLPPRGGASVRALPVEFDGQDA